MSRVEKKGLRVWMPWLIELRCGQRMRPWFEARGGIVVDVLAVEDFSLELTVVWATALFW